MMRRWGVGMGWILCLKNHFDGQYIAKLNNPLLLIDPTGVKWVNSYRKNSDEAEFVNQILMQLKESNEELYNYIENLTCKDSEGRETKAMVFFYLSNKEMSTEKDGVQPGKGITPIRVSDQSREFNGISIKIPGGDIPENRKGDIIGGDKSKAVSGVFDILLYRKEQGPSFLTNEAGNIMFSF